MGENCCSTPREPRMKLCAPAQPPRRVSPGATWLYLSWLVSIAVVVVTSGCSQAEAVCSQDESAAEVDEMDERLEDWAAENSSCAVATDCVEVPFPYPNVCITYAVTKSSRSEFGRFADTLASNGDCSESGYAIPCGGLTQATCSEGHCVVTTDHSL